MDSLGGSALALMIACCSPTATAVEETLSTLSYATRAKNIRNRPAVQVRGRSSDPSPGGAVVKNFFPVRDKRHKAIRPPVHPIVF